jgi:hypothetical protein
VSDENLRLQRGGSLLPDLESGVELRLQQIRLICKFFIMNEHRGTMRRTPARTQEEDQVNVLQESVRAYLCE